MSDSGNQGKISRERSLGGQIDMLCDRFEAAWKSSQRLKIEDCLGELPEDQRAALLRELVALEMELRQVAGEHPMREDYLPRFPQFADEITAAFTRTPSPAMAETLAKPEDSTPAPFPALHVRCPHCHNPVEIVDDTPSADVMCRACGSSFSLVGDDALAYRTMGGTPHRRQKVGRFELTEQLGYGAFGAVWKAYDSQLDRVVAVKTPRKGSLTREETEKILREARAAAQLRHPSIVSVHEVGMEGELIYTVSDFIDGITLQDWLTGQRFTSREAAELCVKIADAIHFAHEHGVIHRDLKPSNIMLDRSGEPYIMDFGLAKREAGEVTMTTEGLVLGTPAYMSPEQAKGEGHKADRRTDVYSLGVILFELLTGEMPFRGNMRMILKQVLDDLPPRPRKLNQFIPRDLETICLKCLEKNPAARYATAQELATELRRYLKGEPIKARPISAVARTWRWCKRNPVVAALSAAVAVLVLSVLAAAPVIALHQAMLRGAAESSAEQAKLDATRADEKTRLAEAALYRSRLSEARALRAARPQGWSVSSLENLRLNAEMEIPEQDRVDLRSEAVASLGDLDVQEIVRLRGVNKAIWSLDFSPNGKMLASAGWAGVRVWDVESLGLVHDATSSQPLPFTAHFAGTPFPAIRFHPDGSNVAHTTWDRAVDFFHLPPGTASFPRISSTAHAQAIAIDAAGSKLAVAWTDNNVIVYETASGKTSRAFRTGAGHQVDGLRVALSADGSRLACVGADHAVELRELAGDDKPIILGRHKDTITALCFSRDGTRLISGSNDRTAKIYDVHGARELVTLSGHRARVKAALFLSGGLAATASDDETIRLWDASTGEVVLALRPAMGPVVALAASRDGRTLAAAYKDVVLYRLIDRRAKRTLVGHTYSVLRFAFHPKDPALFSASWDTKVMRWNLGAEPTEIAWVAACVGELSCVAVNPQGTLVAVGNHNFGNVPAVDHDIRLFDARTGELKQRCQGHRTGVNSLAFDSRGRFLASADLTGQIILWNPSTGQLQERWNVADAPIEKVAFLDDGSRLLTGDASGRIAIREVPGGKTVRQTKLAQQLTSLALSGDGKNLAVGTTSGRIEILALPELTPVCGVEHAHQGPVRALAFPADGRMLVSGGEDRRVAAWRFPTPETLFVFPRQESPVHDLAFDPKGSCLAIGGMEVQVTVWDLGVVREHLAAIHLDWESPFVPLAQRAQPDLVPGMKALEAAMKPETPPERVEQKPLGPPYVPKGKLTFVDLQPKANWKLVQDVPGGRGIDLAELPRGVQTFAGVRMRIGDSCVQLGSKFVPEAPVKVEGIQVSAHVAKLYILHAAQTCTDQFGQTVADGTTVALYRVRYEDGGEQVIPVVNGQDIRDWFNVDEGKPATRASVVWTGSNPDAKSRDLTLRLHLSVWENPQPDKKVLSIDFVSTKTPAAPFCVAMTVEEPAADAGPPVQAAKPEAKPKDQPKPP